MGEVFEYVVVGVVFLVFGLFGLGRVRGKAEMLFLAFALMGAGSLLYAIWLGIRLLFGL